jgi:hypothetical protein
VRARGARGVSQVSSLLLAAPRRRGLQSPLGRRVARDLRRRRRSRGPAALPQLSGLPWAAARRRGTSLLQAAALAAGGRARAHRRPTACRRSTVSFRPLPNAEVSSLPWAAALRGCGEARGQATGARAVGRLLLGPVVLPENVQNKNERARVTRANFCLRSGSTCHGVAAGYGPSIVHVSRRVSLARSRVGGSFLAPRFAPCHLFFAAGSSSRGF